MDFTAPHGDMREALVGVMGGHIQKITASIAETPNSTHRYTLSPGDETGIRAGECLASLLAWNRDVLQHVKMKTFSLSSSERNFF